MTQAARSSRQSANGLSAAVGDHDRIDAYLAEALDDLQRTFGGNARLCPILDGMKRFVLSGGKRLRPRLCLASYRILRETNDPPRPIWLTAASLEIFHAFMLVHDDLIDQSTLRRDQPTLHETYRLGADDPSSSLAAKRGSDLALLSGDLLCALGMSLVARSGLGDSTLGRSVRLLSEMLLETGVGETLDVLYETDPLDCLSEAPLVETYLRKTARYTVSGPLVLGATLADASSELCGALDRFGDLLGFGFQIQNDLDSLADDLLAGDHADLDSGKRTYVLWRAHQLSSPRRRVEIREALAQPVSIERRILLHGLIESSGAIKECQGRVDQLHQEAVKLLRPSLLSKTQRKAYLELVEQFRLTSQKARKDFAGVSPVLPLSSLKAGMACNPT